MNKFNLTLLFVAIALTLGAWPESGQIKNVQGGMHGWDSASATWRPFAVSGDGSIPAQSTPTIITEWDQQVVTLVANVAESVPTEISGTRQFITLKVADSAIVPYVALNASATVLGCWPINDSIYLEVPKDVEVSLIASEAVDIFVIEGGY